jgi:hypothetical protein
VTRHELRYIYGDEELVGSIFIVIRDIRLGACDVGFGASRSAVQQASGTDTREGESCGTILHPSGLESED